MPSSTPLEDRRYTRRGLLKRGTAGGLVVGGAAATYGAARYAAKEGEVTVRAVGTQQDDGQLLLFYRELDPDGPDAPRIHESVRGRLDGGTGPGDPYRVPDQLHRDLSGRYGDLDYFLGHRCREGVDCSTPQVGRGLFNDLSLGERVRLLYVPPRAHRVP